MVGRRMLLLAIGTFLVATDGTLVIGLLRQIAPSVSASAAAAGLSVTAYAVVYAIGAPLMIRATRQANPARLLVGALALFALGNAATASAASLPLLLLARVLTASAAGVFMATAATVAAAAVPLDRRGRALAVLVAGSSTATAIGVPVGTLVGGAVGWRTMFYCVAALSASICPVVSHAVSSQSEAQQAPVETRAFRRSGLPILLTTLLWAMGSFTFFTYIGVVLHDTAGAGTAGLAGFFLIFGLAGVGGAAAAGRLIDTIGPRVALTGGIALSALSLAGLAVTAMTASDGIAVAGSIAAIAGYGLGTWAITPAQQHRLLAAGGDHRLLLAMNSSALYAGVALGSAVGGATLKATASPGAVCWAAAAIELMCLIVLAWRPDSRVETHAGGEANG